MKKKKMAPEEYINNCLFRFRAVNDNNLSALENDRLYFSTPESFNDPYDNLMYANFFDIAANISNSLEMGMESYIQKRKKDNLHMAAIADLFWHGAKKDEVINDILSQVYNALEEIRKGIRANVKIICFAKEYASMLMWAHYADSHCGFALAYEEDVIRNAERFTLKDEPVKKAAILEPVEYVEEQIDLTREMDDYIRCFKMLNLEEPAPARFNLSQEKLHTLVMQKSIDWKYEKEWRLVPKHISLDSQSKLGYIKCIPKAVILGTQCTENDRKKIIHICKKKKIPIYEMILNFWEPGFKLEIISERG